MNALTYAKGRDWYIEERKPHGGFCFVHANSLLAVWASLTNGEIALRDFRVWLACHEMQARRCQIEQGRLPQYGLEELTNLIGATAQQHTRASLRRLTRLGHLDFQQDHISLTPASTAFDLGRPVPVPRPVLRMLCKERGRAFIATTLGHILRCLFYKNGVCRSGGWCKASWIAETFQVAVRAVKEARKRLVAAGFCRLLDADQLRLNRWGRPLVWVLEWGRRSAPRPGRSTTKSAPPNKHKKLSYRRTDHQKPAHRSGPAGTCKQASQPDLRNVRVGDLKDPWRLAALFKQARLRGWVKKTEADILAVFAAAAHAQRCAARSVSGMFVWLIKSGQWSHLSNDDDEKGRRMLRELMSLRDRREEPTAT